MSARKEISMSLDTEDRDVGRHEVNGPGVCLGTRTGHRLPPASPDVRLSPAAAAREHTDPDRCRRVPRPTGAHLPPGIPASAAGPGQPDTSRVRLVLDL